MNDVAAAFSDITAMRPDIAAVIAGPDDAAAIGAALSFGCSRDLAVALRAAIADVVPVSAGADSLVQPEDVDCDSNPGAGDKIFEILEYFSGRVWPSRFL